MRRLFLLIAALAASCSQDPLTVHTQYLGLGDLASYHVGTPDPHLYNPPIGQQLLISWNLPQAMLLDPDLHLDLTVRFGNKEECKRRIPLLKRRGTYLFPLTQEAYFVKKGIQTYNIVLSGMSGPYLSRKHMLWKEQIAIGVKFLEPERNSSAQMKSVRKLRESSRG